ncbi:Proteasome subunit alpha type-7 [Astathelohania contejeani]|uniref:Proteasome subunit alpha type-7 n=1 Tax=Astathelohania contejeani TaxID=164912 RepID=A0ABQ7HWE6_9MICR|nr:Proteasome subunit alpha type-7 [Thelohania contejeani]
MAYDKSLAVFSPDGRLIQVEYAQQSSEHGSLVVFAVGSDHISLSLEKRTTNKMLLDEEIQKLVTIDSELGIYMTFSGLTPDSYVIISRARLICRNYRYSTGEDITLTQLVERIGEFKQRFTIEGGKRPFGIRSVVVGFEDGYPHAYIVEPDGNFSEYRGGAIGQKCVKVMEFLENIKEDGIDPVDMTLRGLAEVVQGDINKVSSYIISQKGIEKVKNEIVKEYFNNTQ